MLFPPQMVILAWLMSRSLQLLESSHLLGPASLLHTDTLLNSLRPEAPGSQLAVVTQGSTAYFPRASSQKGTALPFPGSFLHHPRPSFSHLSLGRLPAFSAGLPAAAARLSLQRSRSKGVGRGAPEDHGIPGLCPSPGNLRTMAQRDLGTELCLSNETVTASASSGVPPTAPLGGGSGWLSSGVVTERTRVALSQAVHP